MSDLTLLPCPFCGSAARLEHEAPAKTWKWSVECEAASCAATPVVIGSTEAIAISRWNTRAQSSDVLSSLQVGE